MSLRNAIGGVALIAGTAIGAAVLALPASTAHMGFIPTILLYVLCWTFMTLGALYLLEANLAVGYGTNLLTMAEKTLGKKGRYFTWVIYLLLLYALTAAYLSGTGAWINESTMQLQFTLSHFQSALLATFFTMFIIFLGTAVTDWVNRLLMIGLLATFVALLGTTSHHINPSLLMHTGQGLDIKIIPLIITAFGFAIVIPTLTEYLHGKGRQLFIVVIVGSILPLITYIIWEMTILGVIPLEGANGLLAIQKGGHPATAIPLALQTISQNALVAKAASGFSIFALITSLLGVCLSLFDFLADGLHLQKRLHEKLLLSAITFLPPLAFLLYYPRGFALTLSFAGIFVSILLGILPALMVWESRYRQRLAPSFQVFGGKILLIITILFFVFAAGIECYNQYHAML